MNLCSAAEKYGAAIIHANCGASKFDPIFKVLFEYMSAHNITSLTKQKIFKDLHVKLSDVIKR